MRIRIAANTDPDGWDHGPYETLDTIERETPYAVGDQTHFGEVIKIPPPLAIYKDVDQTVIVRLDLSKYDTLSDESVLEKPPSSYNKIQMFPITADTLGYLSDEPPLAGTFTIWAEKHLTIENVSHLIKPDTFSIFKRDCTITKATASALDNVGYAIVHRYVSPQDRHPGLDQYSTTLINSAITCLALVRPTRRSRAQNMPGVIKPDGTFDSQGFTATHDPVEVPEIQKLFTVRKQDIELLSTVLPEFMQLYQTDAKGKYKDYEPIRMAVQLYELGYSIMQWKPRHILWWSAIEALYGNSEDAAMARIYAFFGNKDMAAGSCCPIYENNDIPSCYFPTPENMHTLGKLVPMIYKVRNASAHGQKVPDSYFEPFPHPFGQTAGIDVLAEAATFIVRKTVVEVLRRGWRDKFKDHNAREDFWLNEYALPKNQGTRRLKELKVIQISAGII